MVLSIECWIIVLRKTVMECPNSECWAGFVLDQSDVAVSERRWLMHELAQLSGTDVETD